MYRAKGRSRKVAKGLLQSAGEGAQGWAKTEQRSGMEPDARSGLKQLQGS